MGEPLTIPFPSVGKCRRFMSIQPGVLHSGERCMGLHRDVNDRLDPYDGVAFGLPQDNGNVIKYRPPG